MVGGHTCEGAELALGLSVNGVAKGGEASLLGKGGAAAGDALVLTKAVRFFLLRRCVDPQSVVVEEGRGVGGLALW